MTKCHKTVVQTQRGRSSDIRAGISNESIESKCTSNLGSTTLSLWAIMLMLCVCVCVCSAVVCVCVWLHVWMFRISRAGELLSRHWRRTQPFSSAHHRLSQFQSRLLKNEIILQTFLLPCSCRVKDTHSFHSCQEVLFWVGLNRDVLSGRSFPLRSPGREELSN